MPGQIPAELAIPLYGLYYVDSIEDYEGLSGEHVESFGNEYGPMQRRSIVDALRWVREHPEADLSGVLPNLPFSNTQIHSYAIKVLHSLEDAGA